MFNWFKSHLEWNHGDVLACVSSECRAGFNPPSAFSLTKLPQIKPWPSFKTPGPHVLNRPLITNESAWVMTNIYIYKLCFVAISESRSVINSLIIFTSVEKRRKKLFSPLLPLKETRVYINYGIKSGTHPELCVMKCFWADPLAWCSCTQTVSVRNNVTDHQRDFTAPAQQARAAEHRAAVKSPRTRIMKKKMSCTSVSNYT